MTRKSKARYGMNRTYKLNAAVKALRSALFAGMAMAAVAPAAQAACAAGATAAMAIPANNALRNAFTAALSL